MKKNPNMKKLFTAFLLICVVAIAQDAIRIAAGRGTPIIDGVLDDAVWNDSIACGPFLVNSTNSFAGQQTTVRFLWDDKCLYAAFKCDEKVLNPVHNRLSDFAGDYQGADRDGIYKSDMVQLLLGNPENNKLYDVIVSASSVISDSVAALDAVDYWERRDHGWQSNATVGVKVKEDGQDPHWSVEIALPWSELGGAPKLNDTRLILASRRERAFKETTALQAVDGGIHFRKFLGSMLFLEKVPGVAITSFPRFLPGSNALKVVHTNSQPAHLNGNIAFYKASSNVKKAIGKTEGELPFTLERSGDFTFRWYLSQGSTVYYSSPYYKCHVTTSILEASLSHATLSVNGVEVKDSLLPLETGVNTLELKSEAGAEVSLKVGGTIIPYPNGWFKDKNGVERLTLLCEESVVWPNWHIQGIHLNRGGLQQLLFFPQGIPGKSVTDYTMTVELPKGITLLGASGYYSLYPLEVKRLAAVVHDGIEYTPYSITVAKKLPYVEKLKSYQLIALILSIDENIALTETQILYYASSKDAHSIEIPNRFPVHIIDSAIGVKPQRLLLQMWCGWLKSMDNIELRQRLFEYIATAGVNEVNCSVDNVDGLRGMALFNFKSWNFSCGDYLKEHPEQAQLCYDGTRSKDYVCSTNIVRNPDFAAFLKKRMKPWHDRYPCKHIDLDYEANVKNSFFSCYCPTCIEDFARFANISPEGLNAESINQNHLPQWQVYCHRRLADFAALLAKTIHEELPGVIFSIYSGYQSEKTKLVYGIDWSMVDGIVDIACCGYGRPPKELKETQDCIKKSALLLGEIIHPYDIYLRIAPQVLREASLVRRSCDATKGFLVYEFATMDGYSLLSIANASKILAKYEPFFTTGIRTPDKLKPASEITNAEYEMLGDGQGNFLIVLMNLQEKTRFFALDVEIPEGKSIFDEEGNKLDAKLTATLDAFKTKTFLVK